MKFGDTEAEDSLCEPVVLVQATLSGLFLAFAHGSRTLNLCGSSKKRPSRKISITRGEEYPEPETTPTCPPPPYPNNVISQLFNAAAKL
jgi:hypothetical protein